MPLYPGATIGILGGGQLGRMTAIAARELGFRVMALDPDPHCPARGVVDRCITAAFDDAAAAEQLASEVDVVTFEIEKIDPEALRRAALRAPLRPSAEILEMVQQRDRQRAWLEAHGFPVGPHRAVTSSDEIARAIDELGGSHFFLKASHGGYDGRGQFELSSAREADSAHAALGRVPCVLERGLELELELSVMIARRPSGEVAVFPPAQNHHEQRILAWSVLPASLDPALERRCVELGRDLASALSIEGLIAVELFVTRDGALFVNELAPRPHNTFHSTQGACLTSQFEQLVRAVCDLPLGAVDVVRPAAIVNLLGDLWLGAEPPCFEAALAIPGVRLHLYGKREAREGRKMGHLLATGASGEEAVAKAHAALRALSRS